MPVEDHTPLPPTTTVQQDMVTASQRKINLIWEWTQAIISIMVVLANMIVATVQGLTRGTDWMSFPVILSSSLFLIVGFYFSRTNHSAVGGIGPKPTGTYDGR